MPFFALGRLFGPSSSATNIFRAKAERARTRMQRTPPEGGLSGDAAFCADIHNNRLLALGRDRKQERFRRIVEEGTPIPVAVADGDSWLQLPIISRDTVSQLLDMRVPVFTMATGGNYASCVARDDNLDEIIDTINALRAQYFIFSCGGNDLLFGYGLEQFVYNRGRSRTGSGLNNWLNKPALRAAVDNILETNHRKIINTIMSRTNVQLITHGYNYGNAINVSNPPHLGAPYIGTPISTKGLYNPAITAQIMRFAIDHLNNKLKAMMAEQGSRAHFIDLRRQRFHYVDEIHPNNSGYRVLSEKIARIMTRQLVS